MPDESSAELSPRGALWLAAVLVLLLIAVFVGIKAFESALSRAHRSEQTTTQIFEPPAPHLQVDSARELAALRAADEQKLNSYGWVDRPAGVIRIPIERAIELTAQRGLPTRPPAKGTPP